ncbi:MAG: endonuclease III [Haloglomus sp.]
MVLEPAEPHMDGRIRDIHAALVDEHGEPDPPRERPAVDSLIHTILSQNTTDENRDAAWDSLVAEFGHDYEAIERADHDALAASIRTAGLADQKATRIQDALRTVREHTGGDYSLEFIADMDVEEAQEWLTNIRGIGDKTAGIILLFRFGKPYFPVDTHCERLAKRFDLIPEDASYSQAHDLLTECVPDDIKYSFHRLLIDHGRAYCTARNANCDNPVCREFCDCEYC